MTYVSLWSPGWETAGVPAEVLPAILAHAPRAALGAAAVWVDARGMDAARLAESLLAALPGVSAGIAEGAVVAEVAARGAEAGAPRRVPAGAERAFLEARGLEVLAPAPPVLRLLRGAGVGTCGALAALPRESVEVRFGAEGSRLWRLARGEEPRRLFAPIPAELPAAEVDFVDHSVADAGRLAFAANALLGTVCRALQEAALRARTLRLTLPLEGGGAEVRELRTRRPTAERAAWLARLRETLDRLELADRVVGVSLAVADVEGVSATQGDLFDRGFATTGPVEEAVARLVDRMGPVAVRPAASRHPLPDRRTTWIPQEPEAVAEAHAAAPEEEAPAELTLQRPEHPLPLRVATSRRHGCEVPVRYRTPQSEWRVVREVAGPDRISGGLGAEDRFAREYYLGTDEEGRVVWLYRDALAGGWYLQGWFD